MQLILKEARLPEPCGEDHAITDVYCGARRRSLVTYPGLLVAGLVLTGIASFLLVGFLGYINCRIPYIVDGKAVLDAHGKLVCWRDPWANFLYLKEPWPLYLWLSGLMVLLQVSILRKERLSRLIATLLVTLASIIVVAIVYLIGPSAVVDFLRGLLYLPSTYTIANFGIIIAFIVDSTRRWLRHRATKLSREDMGELISGDLIAGMALVGVLSIIFTESFMRGFFVISGAFPTCGTTTIAANVAANLPACPIPATADAAHNPLVVQIPFPIFYNHHLHLIDLFLAVLCFVPGILVLANTAFIRAIRQLEPDRSTSRRAPRPGAVRRQVAAEVAETVLEALRDALERYIVPYLRSAILSLRNILWPSLILIGSFSLALCSRYVQYYLHHYDPANPCVLGIAQCAPPNPHTYLGIAIIFGLVGLFATIFSLALFLISGRVVSNSFRFVGRLGGALLITYWMFSLVTFGINWFLLDTGAVPASLSQLPPFDGGQCRQASWQTLFAPSGLGCSQPFGLSWLTAFSFGALLVALGLLVLRSRRRVA